MSIVKQVALASLVIAATVLLIFVFGLSRINNLVGGDRLYSQAEIDAKASENTPDEDAAEWGDSDFADEPTVPEKT